MSTRPHASFSDAIAIALTHSRAFGTLLPYEYHKPVQRAALHPCLPRAVAGAGWTRGRRLYSNIHGPTCPLALLKVACGQPFADKIASADLPMRDPSPSHPPFHPAHRNGCCGCSEACDASCHLDPVVCMPALRREVNTVAVLSEGPQASPPHPPRLHEPAIHCELASCA